MNSSVHYSSQRQDWTTPDDLFQKLDAEFHFALDACATNENTKCDLFYSPETDGLTAEWTTFVKHGAVFCNPPYSDLGKWIEKCFVESTNGLTVVMLIPARTDTAAWHRWIWNNELHEPYLNTEVRFLKGRLKFGGAKNSAPFPSAIVVFRPPEGVHAI